MGRHSEAVGLSLGHQFLSVVAGVAAMGLRTKSGFIHIMCLGSYFSAPDSGCLWWSAWSLAQVLPG